MSVRDYCNGAGHKGGAKSYRVCPGCGIRKANTAFRSIGKRGGARAKGAAPLAEVCMKCEGGVRRADLRGGQGGNTQHDYIHLAAARMPFDVWMEAINATAEEYALVHRALQRYGLKGPCPDDILTAEVQPSRYGKLFHATVLLAHERNHMGRMGTYNLSPDDPRAIRARRGGTHKEAA